MAGMAQPLVRNLGDYIRDQRRSSQISLRQLARLAGVSNPYLSQIERGLRKPSAEILQQIAKALRISAEALYVQAGILEPREGDGEVVDAVLRAAGLTERQKQVLIEIYDSFRKENEGRDAEGTLAAETSVLAVGADAPEGTEASAETAVAEGTAVPEGAEESELEPAAEPPLPAGDIDLAQDVAAAPATDTPRSRRKSAAGTGPKSRRTPRPRAKAAASRAGAGDSAADSPADDVELPN
jgi:transcriptional regulator with XRE-family HTH domain